MYSEVRQPVTVTTGFNPLENDGDRVGFRQMSKFLSVLNRSQTTNLHSYRASCLKSILLEHWFGYGKGVTRDTLIKCSNEEPSYIRRFLGRYIDEGRCYERGGIIYPSQDMVAHMANVCDCSETVSRFELSECELRISPDLLGVATQLTYRRSFKDRSLSGQLIRLELALWEQMIDRNGELMSTSDIAIRANIKKSTLTTLLNAAVTRKMLNYHIDDNDERITRWGFNMSHPRNTQMLKTLAFRYPEMRRALGGFRSIC